MKMGKHLSDSPLCSMSFQVLELVISHEAAELGVKEIFVTGGEPFLLEDIGEILIACLSVELTTDRPFRFATALSFR